MAKNESSESHHHEASESNGKDFEAVLAVYLGRLNDGEALDADQILADHPNMGEEILEGLEAFMHMAGSSETNETLGTLGGYTILSQIGRGGMGVVYEALDKELDRRVALKVLPAGLKIDEKSVVRFRREARIVGKLPPRKHRPGLRHRDGGQDSVHRHGARRG